MTSKKIQFALFFIFFVSFSFTSSIALPISEETAVELFQEWKEKHGKVYKQREEEEKRFQNFNNNLNYIMEMMNSRTEHKVGLNKFADLSNDEFRDVYLSKVTIPTIKKRAVTHVESFDAPPSSLDWRKLGAVTGVKDQGTCGSCWSFSSTGAMEGIHAIATGNLVSLSAQELVDCDSTSSGCSGGFMNNAFEWVIYNGGINSESRYPYIGSDSICDTSKINEKVVSIDGYKDVNDDERSLLYAVSGQPISVAIDGGAIDFQLYTDGIYDGDCSSDPNTVNHAVLIVGYESKGDQEYWIAKNSWGTGWGKDGYMYIKKNTTKPYGVCGINSMASYPTMETSYPVVLPPSSPPPSPPPPPPPPPPPVPSDCGKFFYCSANETCCCVFELFNYCLLYGCCEYENAVCCTGGAGNGNGNGGVDFCCPSDYPICDLQEALCLKNEGDYLGMPGKKLKMAKRKLPWSVEKRDEDDQEETTKVLQWKRRNPFAVV